MLVGAPGQLSIVQLTHFYIRPCMGHGSLLPLPHSYTTGPFIPDMFKAGADDRLTLGEQISASC